MRAWSRSALVRATLALSALLSSVNASPAPARLDERTKPINDTTGDHAGAVASENKICSGIGADMLKMGGTAADAMVGTQICVGVLGMSHSGIGGGGFMIVRNSSNSTSEKDGGHYEFIDFREKAPAAAYKDMYDGNYNGSLFGGLASGVPGELRGLEHLHTNYGKLPWKMILEPSIKLARDGFVVDEDLANAFVEALETAPYNFFVEDPSWAIDFAPNGTLVKQGQTMYRKRLADTLETIANWGVDAFYHGAIANATITAVRAANGTMTLEDLKNYSVAIREPSQITYRGFRLTSCSAPSSGEVALAILKIFEGYSDVGEPSAINITTHRLDEAMRWAYAERSTLADPYYVYGLTSYEESMLNPKSAAEIRSKITDYSHNVSYYNPAGIESLMTPGTSHVVAADASGMAVSLTSTVNLLFGSQVMVPETGVIMNDEMNDFSIPGSSNAFGYVPSPNNYIAPGKRPLSSISPTIVEFLSNGSLYFATGAAGGSRITTATVQTLWHVLDQGANSYEALGHPRFHDQLEPNTSSFEYKYDNDTTAFMESRGHNVTWVAPGLSTAQCLRRLPNGTFEAAGEPRQANSGGVVI